MKILEKGEAGPTLDSSANNLCYNCTEKLYPRHKCKSTFFLLIQQEDEGKETALQSKEQILEHDGQLSPSSTSNHLSSNQSQDRSQILHSMAAHTKPKIIPIRPDWK